MLTVAAGRWKQHGQKHKAILTSSQQLVILIQSDASAPSFDCKSMLALQANPQQRAGGGHAIAGMHFWSAVPGVPCQLLYAIACPAVLPLAPVRAAAARMPSAAAL